VAFIERVNPRGMTFYYGFYNGIFSFYLQASDLHFQRGVVAGHRLFSAPRLRSAQIVTPHDVLAAIWKRCRCEWIIVERGTGARPERMHGLAKIRSALATANLELVRSFNIADGLGTILDVYRLRGDASQLDRVDVSIPRYGGTEDVYPVKPFSR
jgi:hypothetical protein